MNRRNFLLSTGMAVGVRRCPRPGQKRHRAATPRRIPDMLLTQVASELNTLAASWEQQRGSSQHGSGTRSAQPVRTRKVPADDPWISEAYRRCRREPRPFTSAMDTESKTSCSRACPIFG